MAYRTVLLSFLLIICMSSAAYSSFLEDNGLLGDSIVDPNIVQDLTGIGRVSVTGIVRCPLRPSTRNEPSLPAGTNVALTCNGERTVISDAVTDADGFFEITLDTLVTSLLHPNQCQRCRIFVRGTSEAACGINPGKRGALLAPIRCRDAVVEQLHESDHHSHSNTLKYQAESFYYDTTYH